MRLPADVEAVREALRGYDTAVLRHVAAVFAWACGDHWHGVGPPPPPPPAPSLQRTKAVRVATLGFDPAAEFGDRHTYRQEM